MQIPLTVHECLGRNLQKQMAEKGNETTAKGPEIVLKYRKVRKVNV